MEAKEKMVIREKVHIVLRGSDGKVKDERVITTEATDETKNGD